MVRGPLQKLPAAASAPRKRKKPGPKPRSIRDRHLDTHSVRPLKRIERSYSRETKIKVLKFHFLYQIPIKEQVNQYRTPTLAETSSVFLISESTIHGWIRKEDDIIHQSCKSFGGKRESFVCCWPELKVKLYEMFLIRRAEGKIVRRGWFRRQSQGIFRESYLSALAVFVFSDGWFHRFLTRHHISIRFTTNMAQKIPDDYRKLIINWLRFNRHVSQPQNAFERARLVSDIGHYLLSNIVNLDETPIPFEYLDGRTYDTIGLRTIWAKSAKSGWDKCQASLILVVFADGVPRIMPKIIFHATTGNKITAKEGHLYDKRVTVEFNSTAYNNEKVFSQQITREIAPAFGGRPSLFVLDAAKFHKTPAVLDLLSSYHIMPSMIPGGCTGLIQPLDVFVNRPLKDMLREEVDNYIDQEEKQGKTSWTTSKRRVMTTICVGRVWESFCIEKRHIVQQSFRNLGLALPTDGSCDDELNIKGFTSQDLVIGDWTRDYNSTVAAEYRDLPEVYDDSEAMDFVSL